MCEPQYALTLLNVFFPLRFFCGCFELRTASKSFAFITIEHALLKRDKNRSFSLSRLVKQPKSSWRIPSGNFINVPRTGVGLEMLELALNPSRIATAVRWILRKTSSSAKFDWGFILMCDRKKETLERRNRNFKRTMVTLVVTMKLVTT